MKAILFASSPASDIRAELAFVNNLAAIVAPTATDDSSKGYQTGSQWVNTSTKTAYTCVDATAGAAIWGVSADNEDLVQAQIIAPPASTVSGAGGAALLSGGTGGATSGNGGPATVAGGAAAGGNSNGGSVILTGGAHAGSGVDGAIIERGVRLINQGAPTVATTSALLTAAGVLAGIITVLQGAAGASAQQLPLATAMDTALPDAAAGDAFDFSVINISTNAAETASLTTNTGWTLVGDMDISANSAATTKSAGRFRARKTATGAWTLYRLS